MSEIVEGGGEFIDYRDPEKPFKTKIPGIWDAHLRETGATMTGVAPCVICGKPVEFTDLKFGSKPVCDSCKEEMR